MNLSPRKYSKDVIYVLIIKQKKEKPAPKPAGEIIISV